MIGLRRIAVVCVLSLTGCAHGFGYPAGGFLGLFGHDECSDCYQSECESCATCEVECTSCGPDGCDTCDEDCRPCRTPSHGGYKTSHDLLVTGHYARRCSRKAIEQLGLKNMPSDFRDGFEQAYEDIADGQSGAVPAIPPEKYWTAYYRSADGKRHAQLWFDGYRAGAASALGKKESLYGPVADSGVVYDPDPVPRAGVRQSDAVHGVPYHGPVMAPPGWQPHPAVSSTSRTGLTPQHASSPNDVTAGVPHTAGDPRMAAADSNGQSWSRFGGIPGSPSPATPQTIPQRRSVNPAARGGDSQAAGVSSAGLQSLAQAGVVGHGVVESLGRSRNDHAATAPDRASSGNPGGPAQWSPDQRQPHQWASAPVSADRHLQGDGAGSPGPAEPLTGTLWSEGIMHPTGLPAYHNYRQ